MKLAISSPASILLLVIGLVMSSSSCTPHFRLDSLRMELDALQSRRIPTTDLEGYKDFRGVIHVHSYISHDSAGTYEEILGGARETGVDFIITTDHDTPHIFTEGLEGWYGDILVIRGMELIKECRGTADLCASLLAVGIGTYFDHNPLTFQQILDEVRRQGGLAFVAHPKGWPDWSLEGIAGMEIYDILDDVMDRRWKFTKYFWDILYSYRRYSLEVFMSIQDHPTWHLEQWDRLAQTRKVVGIAGNDAHQNVRVLGRQLDPYPLSFRFVTTHVLAPRLDRAAVLAALRAGHAYVAFDFLSDPSGFGFILLDGTRQALMGDERSFVSGQMLTTQLPTLALIVMIKDGKPFRQCLCSRFSVPVEGPGVYRVEVFLKIQNRWRPWIFSNPIYVR